MRDRKNASELLDELNDTDESERLEAKSVRYDSARSLLETICAFSNEPNLGGGIIVLGIAERDAIESPRYEVEDGVDLDRRQLDIATQCKSCFNRPPGATQSRLEGVPGNVLREAVVNALMHASYKVGSPTQIVRYPNRIEIRNAGYSLKSPERYGMSGSVPRNRNIAPVFHETNLAETKGGGMRRMARDMLAAHLTAPTYESDRVGNTFTLRLLLHRFLNDRDLAWLAAFAPLDLSDGQKMALVFLREVGAIDNNAYRQLSGLDTLHASYELRRLKDLGLIEQKGKGQRTYYRPGLCFPAGDSQDKAGNSQDNGTADVRIREVCSHIGSRLSPRAFEDVVIRLCGIKMMSAAELARVMGRSSVYMAQKLGKLVKEQRLQYRYPAMSNHSEQTYGIRGKTLACTSSPIAPTT